MTRVTIDRIVIEADGLDPRDAESLREGIERELAKQIESAGLPERIESRARIQGGALPASPGDALPQQIAGRVVQSLGGKS